MRVQCILRALSLGSRRLGNMEWFVQTPQYSFKNTLKGRILLVVFALERCYLDSTPFHPEWCAQRAHDVSKCGRSNNREDLAALRIVVKEGFSRDLADLLLSDIERHLRFFASQPGYRPQTKHSQFRH